MTRWFRHYAGMVTDPKFAGISRRLKRPVQDVVFIFQMLLESCAEHNGSEYAFDADTCDEIMRLEDGSAQRIVDELERSGLLGAGRVAKWDARQFASDNSTPRVQRGRRSPADDETATRRYETAPESESDSEEGKDNKRAMGNLITPSPERIADLFAVLSEAAGAALGDPAIWTRLRDLSPILSLMAGGADQQPIPLAAIVDHIRKRAPRLNPGTVRGWSYFTRSILEEFEAMTKQLQLALEVRDASRGAERPRTADAGAGRSGPATMADYLAVKRGRA